MYENHEESKKVRADFATEMMEHPSPIHTMVEAPAGLIRGRKVFLQKITDRKGVPVTQQGTTKGHLWRAVAAQRTIDRTFRSTLCCGWYHRPVPATSMKFAVQL
jgi:hypothetical protein